MLMEACEAASDVLLQRPWLPVNISGCQLLAKSSFGEVTYHLLLTDTHCVWEEHAAPSHIQQRAQELNRRLRAPVEAFFTHLCQVVRPCLARRDSPPDGGPQISLIWGDDGDLRVKLKSELAGLPFYWEFHCRPAPLTVVCTHLLRPLLVMSHLLQRQVGQLEGLLVRKDAEIQDFRENGATLSRERLQTGVFEEQTFRENFMAKTLPLLCSDQQEVLNFHADLQHLYADVVAHGNALRRKRKPLEEETKEERLPAEEADRVLPQVSAALTSSGTGEDNEQSQRAPVRSPAPCPASVPQVPPLMADPTPSKSKKKKVGLFK